MKMTVQVDLGRLYDAHAQALFAFLLNLTRNESDTRDLLQEIFVRVARNPDLLRGIRRERAFLLTMAHNAAVDMMRKHEASERAGQSLEQDSPVVIFAESSDHDEAVLREAMSKALGDLPSEQRAVVHLKLWEGMTFERIAETLQIPLNTAASRYRYGIDKLRDALRLIYGEIV